MVDLLWISVETPCIDGGGGQRRQFHQISALVQSGVEVEVATLSGRQDDSTIRRLAPVHRFDPRPFGTRRNRGLERLIEAVAPQQAVVAHVESVPHVSAELQRSGVPFLLDFQNVASRWHSSLGDDSSANEWRRREREGLIAAVQATACSIEEQGALAELGVGTPITVAPQGVDPEEWPRAALSARRGVVVTMFGSWNHGPNRIAAEWLALHVWPRVHGVLPEAQLLLLGPSAPPAVVLRQDGVEFMGRVASLAAVLGRARVAVVPIQRGIGTRVKFIESLASGAAVVSTTLGCEGFEAEGTFVQADGPEPFANACIELLRDEPRAVDLGERGRELAFSRYNWVQVTEPILDFARGR